MQGLAATVADVDRNSRTRIERMVHEAMLTMRMQMDRERAPVGRSCWPDYVYEREDWGDRPGIDELRPLVPPWRPEGRHLDEMEWVFLDCYGKWANPRSGKNGLEKWQWLILELRAWKAVYGLDWSWRNIADAIASRPLKMAPSHEWVRIEHRRLIDIAVSAARRMGRV